MLIHSALWYLYVLVLTPGECICNKFLNFIHVTNVDKFYQVPLVLFWLLFVTGWHIKSRQFHFIAYDVYTESFYNISTMPKTFKMFTLCCSNWSHLFLKMSDCPINQICQTSTCLSVTSWMMSQRIFNVSNNIAKDISSLSSLGPVSAIYILQEWNRVEQQFMQIMCADCTVVHLFLHHPVVVLSIGAEGLHTSSSKTKTQQTMLTSCWVERRSAAVCWRWIISAPRAPSL